MARVTQARQREYLKCTKLKLPLNWFKTLFWKLQEQIMRKDDSCILNCKQLKRQGKILFLSRGNLRAEEIRVTACHRLLKKVFRHTSGTLQGEKTVCNKQGETPISNGQVWRIQPSEIYKKVKDTSSLWRIGSEMVK